jgi:integrase
MNLDLITKMDSIDEFMYTIKSEETKRIYRVYIKYFEDFAGISLSELLKMNVQDIQNIIIKYIVMMREKGLSTSSIKGRVAPISSFLQLNDTVLNIKRISKFYGEQKKTVSDLAYTIEDIKAMLNIAKPRMRVMILIYSSTGIRKSALLDLKLKHLQKIPKFNLYKFTIYENTNDQYTTFCTPECANAIDEYLEYRKEAGETITKESYLVRNDFGKLNDSSINNPKPVTQKNINTVFRQLLIKANLRNQHENQYERRDKSMFQAYRKFFNTTLANANVSHLVKELLMGHSVGLDGSYYRPNEQTMLVEYAKAINKLSISEEEQLRVENKNLQIESSQYESLRSAFEKLNNEVSRLKQQQK